MRFWIYLGWDFECFLLRWIGMVNLIIILLFLLKFVILVVFILNFGFLSLIFFLNFFLFINKDVKKVEFFFCGVNGCIDLRRFWKFVIKGFKGGYFGKCGFVKFEKSGGIVMLMNWEIDVFINIDKISKSFVFF